MTSYNKYAASSPQFPMNIFDSFISIVWSSLTETLNYETCVEYLLPTTSLAGAGYII